MLRIDRAKRTMMRLGPKPLATAGILERNDLQQMIKNAPAEFFAELGEQLLPLGEEIRASEVVDDRIDLLALDACPLGRSTFMFGSVDDLMRMKISGEAG